MNLLEIIEAVDGLLNKFDGITRQAKKQRYAVNMEAICAKATDLRWDE